MPITNPVRKQITSHTMKLAATALTVLLVLSITACKPTQFESDASIAVNEFYLAFNEQRFDDIYLHGHPDFKSSDTQENIVDFIESAFQFLGPRESSSPPKFISHQADTPTIEVQITTQYENGSANETFIFKKHQDQLKLILWTIEDQDLQP